VLCDVIKGTKSIIKPVINSKNNIIVDTTAKLFENLNLFLKNSTIGLAIIEKITATTR
jgi:hypothetical protein